MPVKRKKAIAFSCIKKTYLQLIKRAANCSPFYINFQNYQLPPAPPPLKPPPPKPPPKPNLQTSVYDYANLLNTSEKQNLEQKLVNYADSTSTQIVVVIVPAIKGENIGLLAPKWAQEWGVGQSDKDNGVFILLAEQERRIWISPGYGVEDKLTAGIVGELTRNIIIPEFKAGSYYNGTDDEWPKILRAFR